MSHHLDLHKLHHTPGKSDICSHLSGTSKAEEWISRRGREPGRDDPKQGRTARDSTGINPAHHGPIDPRMPNLPPA